MRQKQMSQRYLNSTEFWFSLIARCAASVPSAAFSIVDVQTVVSGTLWCQYTSTYISKYVMYIEYVNQ